MCVNLKVTQPWEKKKITRWICFQLCLDAKKQKILNISFQLRFSKELLSIQTNRMDFICGLPGDSLQRSTNHSRRHWTRHTELSVSDPLITLAKHSTRCCFLLCHWLKLSLKFMVDAEKQIPSSKTQGLCWPLLSSSSGCKLRAASKFQMPLTVMWTVCWNSPVLKGDAGTSLFDTRSHSLRDMPFAAFSLFMYFLRFSVLLNFLYTIHHTWPTQINHESFSLLLTYKHRRNSMCRMLIELCQYLSVVNLQPMTEEKYEPKRSWFRAG